MQRLVSGRKTSGPGEVPFIKFQNMYNEVREELLDSNFVPKEFDWDSYINTPVYDAAVAAKEWGIWALGTELYPRGDQRYALKLMLRFFGYDGEFAFERPKAVDPARFLQYGIYNMEMFLAMSNQQVYDMFTGRERTEIVTMAMFVAIFYVPFFLQAKDTARAPYLTLQSILMLRGLQEVHPEIANGALEVQYRHLTCISGPLIVLSLADDKLRDKEKEELGRKVLEVLEKQEEWTPQNMPKNEIVPPDIADDKYWKDNQGNKVLPALHVFVTEESLRMFGLLGWKRDDFQVFRQPCARWGESLPFARFHVFVNGSHADNITGMTLLNDQAERKIALMKARIGKVHEEKRLQDMLITTDELRKRCAGFKMNNFTNKKLQKAIRQILELPVLVPG